MFRDEDAVLITVLFHISHISLPWLLTWWLRSQSTLTF